MGAGVAVEENWFAQDVAAVVRYLRVDPPAPGMEFEFYLQTKSFLFRHLLKRSTVFHCKDSDRLGMLGRRPITDTMHELRHAMLEDEEKH